MAVKVVRLGTERLAHEGVRIGTVRRPPRGIRKTEFAAQNWYDVWYPNLAPSAETMKRGQDAKTSKDWAAFMQQYRKEMAEPAASHSLALLAALSKECNFSVGCYCESEDRCHRSILRSLLEENGAKFQ